MPEPSERQVRIRVRVSGVGPTDLKIRRGDLNGVFALPEPAVLGFETAGVVDAIGGQVGGVAVGDEVAALLPSLGGYGEYALAAAWTRKPPQVSWDDAGALPASVEAAVGVLRQLGVAESETLLILGAGGSVGIIAAQLAIRQGLNVIGAVGPRDEALTRELGATPVLYGSDLLANVREVTDRVDATFDAAGKGGLQDAITLTGGAERVITLADERAAELGVRLSAPTPDRAPDAVEIGMQLLASGELRLRSQQSLQMSAAAEAHRLLEQGRVRHKLLLTTTKSPLSRRNDNDPSERAGDEAARAGSCENRSWLRFAPAQDSSAGEGSVPRSRMLS
jgi:NADPH:quinone reductase-like Zn-dependent oxidoreductase